MENNKEKDARQRLKYLRKSETSIVSQMIHTRSDNNSIYYQCSLHVIVTMYVSRSYDIRFHIQGFTIIATPNYFMFNFRYFRQNYP